MYTITDCQFSKQEREYLSAHKLQFEEKNLETNREFLTEMLAVGSNFAGTPVTKIEKDDGKIEVLKGFTASEFDKALGLATAASVVESVKPVESVEPEVVAPAPVVEVPVVNPAPVVSVAVEAPVAVPVVAAVTTDPAMASLLNNLEMKAQVVAPAPVAPVAPAAPTAPMPAAPVIPDPQF